MSFPVVSNTMQQHGFSIQPVDLPHSSVNTQVKKPVYHVKHDGVVIGLLGERPSGYWMGWSIDAWKRPNNPTETHRDPNSVINEVAYCHDLAVAGV